ncbi:hypothetical protein K458DRAFT_387574 [Lentithecium fluviatile CBS 122367]|uniref:Uncharacterized protein n=1 Tax=Lentithecium fluviatile CBS 122367 TaxID=1168545 RepID=A0A6G1J519_9PLEO|nr:hypothetical protein K458DRAFT_387574 [Lentithecium fluviatile CBS 122367]
MSGNPFRTSPAPRHATAAAPPTSFIDTGTSGGAEARDRRDSDAVPSAATALPAKTKKSVRIESPTETIPPHPAFHDANDALPLRMNHGFFVGAPPLVSPAGFSDNFEDIGGDIYGKREESDARGLTDGLKKHSGVPEAVYSPTGAPANPFSKTLATIEPHEKGSAELAGQNRDRTAAGRPTPAITRQSLDVEGFKNMLMTGISSPRSSGPPPLPQAAPTSLPPGPPAFESSSSTDTSSVSRQSIFEPVQEPHPESPRTSYEMAASDDDRARLMGEVKKEKKKPPPAPKHRHGKLVASRTPRTVPFDGFAPMEPTASPPVVRRQNSDLNKPLPPTPPVSSPSSHIISQDSTHDIPSISDIKTSEIASQSDTALAQKKTPPPVPLARRHSQLRSSTVGNRSRSNSSLTMSSQHSTDFPTPSPSIHQDSISSPSSQKLPPPPPPSRHRGAALSTISTSSANSSSTELSSTAAARRPTLTSPQPPPARRTTLSSEPPSPASGLARTSSMSSNRNTQRTVSNESSSSVNMPPPPPPPRKRTSGGRSSLDKERPSLPSIHSPTSPTDNRRTSIEYKRSSFDSKRRTSVASESSLKYEYAPAAAESEPALYSPREEEGENTTEVPIIKETQSNSNNILDDMERFQKEIEELREKYRHAA